MQAPNIVNTVVDEANRRTYVILAPRVLSDGEVYRVIRQELLRRGGRSLAQGETLTLTVDSSGGTIASATEPQPPKGPASLAAPKDDEPDPLNSPRVRSDKR